MNFVEAVNEMLKGKIVHRKDKDATGYFVIQHNKLWVTGCPEKTARESPPHGGYISNFFTSSYYNKLEEAEFEVLQPEQPKLSVFDLKHGQKFYLNNKKDMINEIVWDTDYNKLRVICDGYLRDLKHIVPTDPITLVE